MIFSHLQRSACQKAAAHGRASAQTHRLDDVPWAGNSTWGTLSQGISSNFIKWVCLKIVYPYTQWFCWSLSLLNGYLFGNIPHFQTYPNIHRNIIWLVVLYTHLEKWWSSSMGRMTSRLSIHIMENNKCSKPPTRYSFDGPSGTISRQWKHIHRKMIRNCSLEDTIRCFECFFQICTIGQ